MNSQANKKLLSIVIYPFLKLLGGFFVAGFLFLVLPYISHNNFFAAHHAEAAAPTYFNSASTPADNGTGADNSTQVVTPPGSMVADPRRLLKEQDF